MLVTGLSVHFSGGLGPDSGFRRNLERFPDRKGHFYIFLSFFESAVAAHITMNNKSLEQAGNVVKASYIRQGEQALNGRKKLVRSCIPQREVTRGIEIFQYQLLLF